MNVDKRKPRTWWYFKETAQTSIKTQEDAATGDSDDPGPVPNQDYWLGGSMYAQHYNCKDVSSLLYKKNYDYQKIPKVKHPIMAGDTIWIYSLPVLGSTVSKIRETLQQIHDCKVNLKIYTIDLSDQLQQTERDYQLLYRALSQLQNIRKPVTKVPNPKVDTLLDRSGKSGRKPRGISYNTLTDDGKRLIRNHCNDNSDFQILYERIQDPKYLGTDIWGKSVTHLGENKLRKIVREYKTAQQKESE